jgi:glycosyltransferase involved in cell wall biosynthesis
MKRTVSIVTVTLNACEDLRQTLASVHSQTYSPIEHVVIDGCSVDGTLDLIKKQDGAVDKWLSENDTGPYDAMNKGLDMASGEYVWFLNAGDTIAADDTLEQVMADAEDADIVYGNAERVDENGYCRPWHKSTPKTSDVSAKSFATGMVICHQALLVRRTMAPHFNVRWTVCADIDWAIRCLNRTTSVRNVDSLICKFLDGGISSKYRMKGLIERFDILRGHFGLRKTLKGQMNNLVDLVRRGRWD